MAKTTPTYPRKAAVSEQMTHEYPEVLVRYTAHLFTVHGLWLVAPETRREQLIARLNRLGCTFFGTRRQPFRYAMLSHEGDFSRAMATQF